MVVKWINSAVRNCKLHFNMTFCCKAKAMLNYIHDKTMRYKRNNEMYLEINIPNTT